MKLKLGKENTIKKNLKEQIREVEKLNEEIKEINEKRNNKIQEIMEKWNLSFDEFEKIYNEI